MYCSICLPVSFSLDLSASLRGHVMLPVLGQSKLKAFLMLYLLLQGTEHCHSGSHPVRLLGPSALAPGASRKRQSLEITVPTGLVIAHRNSRYLLDQSLPLWGGDHLFSNKTGKIFMNQLKSQRHSKPSSSIEYQYSIRLMSIYSTAHVYVNRKTRIKRAKNRLQLRMKKTVRVKKLHVRARLWNLSLISMYEVVLLFSYIVGGLLFWRIGFNSIALKYYTAINDKQTCSLQSPFEPPFPKCYYQCDFVIGIYKWLIIFQRNSFIKIAISHFVYRNIRRNCLGICSK